MEVSQLWSVLYFFMLLLLGIGSMLGNTAAILTPLTDSKVISSYLPKEAISGEWARHQGGGARGAERRRRPQDAPAPSHCRIQESCHSCQALWECNSPHVWPSTSWASQVVTPTFSKGQTPQHGPPSSPGIQRTCFCLC